MAETYYIAGPMAGIDQFNFPRFLEVAEKLRERYPKRNFISPAEIDMEEPELLEAVKLSKKGNLSDLNHTWADFMARDIKLVGDVADGVVLLRGWEKSRGARTEAYFALATRKPVFLYQDAGNEVVMLKTYPEFIMNIIAHETLYDRENLKRYE